MWCLPTTSRACARATARTPWPSCAISPSTSSGPLPTGPPGAITSETRAQTRLQTQGNEPHTAPENGRVEQRLHADSPRCQNALTWIRSPARVGGWLFGLAFGFLLWMLGPIPLLQCLPAQPVLSGRPALGLLLGLLLWGFVLGVVFPFVHRRL